MNNRKDLIIIQTLKGYLYCVLVLTLTKFTFSMDWTFAFIAEAAVIGGFLSLLYGVYLFAKPNENEFDGQMSVDTENHTISFRVNGTVDNLLEKGEIVLKVEDISE